MGVLKRRNNRKELKAYLEENKKFFSELQVDTYNMLGGLLDSSGTKIKYLKTEDGKVVKGNMCKAIEDLYNSGVDEGKELGIEEGKRNLIQVCAEFGKTKAEIALKLQEKYEMNAAEAKDTVDKYWDYQIA